MPGSTLGRYELHELVGKGSMGTVYHGRDAVLDREVAIKMMRTGPHVDPEIKERFYREARACARLQHPNIVTVYDLGEYEGIAYIAMELLVGVDWRVLVKEKRVVPATQKLEFMAQVCDGLAHAHRNTVVHRDIKPSNLFVHHGGQVKILDFGLARLPTSNLTLTGRVLGTPNYMAPEQILGQPCDARSDLFSAAIVFFEFLTGTHPFRGELIPRRIVDGEPERLSEISPSMPDSLVDVFARALANPPACRYQDATQFAADLRAAARELPREELSARAGAAQAGADGPAEAQFSDGKTLTCYRADAPSPPEDKK